MNNSKNEKKKKNHRFGLKSNVKKVLDSYYNQNYHNKTLSDMYEDIAEYCGVSSSTIGQLRLKNSTPSFILAMKLSELVGVNANEIWEVVELDDSEQVEKEKCIVFGCNRMATTKGYCMKHVYFSQEKKWE